ncbi:MAG: hypothetical protein AAF639_12895, partial [Chloroflexota bacterium]
MKENKSDEIDMDIVVRNLAGCGTLGSSSDVFGLCYINPYSIRLETITLFVYKRHKRINKMTNSKDVYSILYSSSFDEQLLWIKEETEREWAKHKTTTFEQYQKWGIGGNSWQTGTKWLGGFSEKEINDAEQKWQIRFPPDYRRF